MQLICWIHSRSHAYGHGLLVSHRDILSDLQFFRDSFLQCLVTVTPKTNLSLLE